jgi:hypothetical protein
MAPSPLFLLHLLFEVEEMVVVNLDIQDVRDELDPDSNIAPTNVVLSNLDRSNGPGVAFDHALITIDYYTGHPGGQGLVYSLTDGISSNAYRLMAGNIRLASRAPDCMRIRTPRSPNSVIPRQLGNDASAQLFKRIQYAPSPVPTMDLRT